MIRSQKRNQSGFTLIEVALAIAIGIIIIIGVTLGYRAVKDAEAERSARDKLGSLKAMIEQNMAANNGVPPAPNTVRSLWATRRSQDYANSPWGGQAQPAAISGITVDPPANVGASTANVINSGGIGYATFSGISDGIFDHATQGVVNFKDYAIFYYDRNGLGPWFSIGGEL